MPDSGEFIAYPQRLHHGLPPWVKSGAYFHIRLGVLAGNPRPLSAKEVASGLLGAAGHYQRLSRWHCLIFLLMPDHVHALIAFPAESRMARVIGDWKRYTTRTLGVGWQNNFFDHRIRDERGLAEKYAYIRRNPVVKGLCGSEDEWPWVWQG